MSQAGVLYGEPSSHDGRPQLTKAETRLARFLILPSGISVTGPEFTIGGEGSCGWQSLPKGAPASSSYRRSAARAETLDRNPCGRAAPTMSLIATVLQGAASGKS
jgi:hypothetical protein